MSTRLSSVARSIRPQLNSQRAGNVRADLLEKRAAPSSQSLLVPYLIALALEGYALVSNEGSLTYGELNEQANQLAHYLVSLGVGQEHIVGICLERSMFAVVGALGVLRSGGAYLPLDPTYPTERLAFMLNDSRPTVLITTQEMEARLPAGDWKTIAVDRDLEKVRAFENTAPEADFGAESLAYVIYTSGSTGQPKGVEVTHANLMNLVTWHQQAFQVTAADRASLLAGVGFDASVWETWPYLAAGASLHLPDETTRLSPQSLRDWMVANRITISFLPTALAERAMTLDWPADTALRHLLTGAEVLHRCPASNLPFTVVNNYGPTECTVVATSGSVPNNSPQRPTIGVPIANTEIHLLNEKLEAVPAGAEGEMYIGGASVARGYLNHPEQTAQRFVPNPFSSDPSARLYRTGDLAHRLKNGELAYLGRIDEQIKILGHRIEPNEITTVLNRHPAIEASVLVASGNGCAEKRLVAYVVLNGTSQTSATELRAFLANELPRYMVPTIFVRLDALPLNRNGKIDRRALPEPEADNSLRDEAFIAPRTPTETRLSVMLCGLLDIDQVSINDNFFMLGGHSLLGTQLIAQIRNSFGVDLTLRALFDAPTIEHLSLEVEQLIMARVNAMSDEEVQHLLA